MQEENYKIQFRDIAINGMQICDTMCVKEGETTLLSSYEKVCLNKCFNKVLMDQMQMRNTLNNLMGSAMKANEGSQYDENFWVIWYEFGRLHSYIQNYLKAIMEKKGGSGDDTSAFLSYSIDSEFEPYQEESFQVHEHAQASIAGSKKRKTMNFSVGRASESSEILPIEFSNASLLNLTMEENDADLRAVHL